jgi:hypothetical protein
MPAIAYRCCLAQNVFCCDEMLLAYTAAVLVRQAKQDLVQRPPTCRGQVWTLRAPGHFAGCVAKKLD